MLRNEQISSVLKLDRVENCPYGIAKDAPLLGTFYG